MLYPINKFGFGAGSFDELFQNFPTLKSFNFSPLVDIEEGKYAYHINADLPGINKDDVNVKIDGNNLILSGERESSEEIDEKYYHHSEKSYGRFERTFSIPSDVDIENIHAESKNGILTLTLPKVKKSIEEEKKLKQIEIT